VTPSLETRALESTLALLRATRAYRSDPTPATAVAFNNAIRDHVAACFAFNAAFPQSKEVTP
jgi:hypothetical protein